MKRNTVSGILTAVAASVVVVACSSGGNGGVDGGVTVPAVQNPNVSIRVDFEIPGRTDEFYENANDFVLSPIRSLNTTENVFNNITVDVEYRECFNADGSDKAGAFYAPAINTASLCDQLTQLGSDLFLGQGYNEEMSELLGLTAMSFVSFHELGHAIVRENQFAIGGNSESIADSFAVVLSQLTGQRVAAFAAAEVFRSLPQAEGAVAFFGEHPGSNDRAGDITCWWLGANPQMIEPDTVFEALAEIFVAIGRDCTSEYADQYAFVTSTVPAIQSINLTGAANPDSETVVLENDALSRLAVTLEQNLDLE